MTKKDRTGIEPVKIDYEDVRRACERARVRWNEIVPYDESELFWSEETHKEWVDNVLFHIERLSEQASEDPRLKWTFDDIIGTAIFSTLFQVAKSELTIKLNYSDIKLRRPNEVI